MSPEESAPKQFNLAALHVLKAVFGLTGQPVNRPDRPPRMDIGLEVGASVQFTPDGSGALVTLETKVVPDKDFQPYLIEVTLAAAFTSPTPGATNELLTFCRVAAPSIMFPYVREIVHRLTMDAPNGPVRLDPVNISAMLNTTDWQVLQPAGSDATTASSEPSQPSSQSPDVPQD